MKLLSERERRLLDSLSQTGSVTTAASLIRYHSNPALRDENMSDKAAYQILYRLRQKYVESRAFVNTILAYRKKNELLRKVLTPTVKGAEEEEADE